MQRRNVTWILFLVYNPDMVDPSMPWSLKGISDEAREFAKQSADNSDIPVGAWLTQVIRAAAAGTPVTASTPAPDRTPPKPSPTPKSVPSPGPSSVPATGRSGSTIERAAQFVDDFGFEPEGPARDADIIKDPAVLQAELHALERRLENAESNAQDNLAPLLDEIERIRARLADSGDT
tara:strand:+ start:707 stop:1240 length:534 start_codon:yes stop_codon:yes gene_type:complete